MTELEFNKEQLKHLEKSLKRNKKYNKFLRIWCVFCVIFLCYYGYRIFNYTISPEQDFKILGYLLCFLCWIFNSTMSLKNLNNTNNTLKELSIEYEELLKKIDHPRFLREQRLEKMSKIKKRIF